MTGDADRPWSVRRVQPGSPADAPGLVDSGFPTAGVSAVVPGSVGATPAMRGFADEADSWAWWWERVVDDLDAPVAQELRWDRVATNADFYLDGHLIATSRNAFRQGSAPVPPRLDPTEGAGPSGGRLLSVRIGPLDEVPVPRTPRPRWRSSLLADRSLRWRRTPLLGRIPAWQGACPPVGILGSCEIVAAQLPHEVRLTTRWEPRDATAGAAGEAAAAGVEDALRGDGIIEISLDRPADLVATLDGGPATVQWSTSTQLVLRVSDARRWRPHTMGEPSSYVLRLNEAHSGHLILTRRVGFASIAARREAGRFALTVDGQDVFVRGVCWVPTDPVGWTEDAMDLRRQLDTLVAAGVNLVRICGTDTYPGDDFHDAAAERGLLVWHDAMLATLDPPSDPAWLADIEAELVERFAALQGRPHVAVLCGGTETLQQPVLFGLLPQDYAMPVLEEVLPRVAAQTLPDVPVVPATPSGGVTPISLREGVSHYFGVGAYLRGLEDAFAAQVSFASEALAFSTPPERATVRAQFGDEAPVAQPRWLAGIPRDRGADWTFQDVTDHYVERFFDRRAADIPDPIELLDLRRAAVAHATSATFAAWRSEATVTAGGIVLAHRDLTDGPGWGWLDVEGRPKAPALSAADVLAARTLLCVDRGLDGMTVSAVDDSGAPLRGTVRLQVFASGARPSLTAELAIHGRHEHTLWLDAVLGWRDLAWHWRFGEPTYRMLRATWLEGDNGDQVVVDLAWPLGPLGRLLQQSDATPVDGVGDGLSVTSAWAEVTHMIDANLLTVAVTAQEAAYFVHLDADGWTARSGWFHLAPGQRRVIEADLAPGVVAGPRDGIRVRALGQPALTSMASPPVT